ncbi:MAG: hypothetical protein ACM37W_16630 [Actinomycetota bacterium]
MKEEIGDQYELLTCPACKSRRIQWAGWLVLKGEEKKQIFQCLDCDNNWSEGGEVFLIRTEATDQEYEYN